MIKRKKWTPQRIIKLRQKLGMTQTEFAEALGIYRQQTISDWECGCHGRILPAYQKLLDVLEAKK